MNEGLSVAEVLGQAPEAAAPPQGVGRKAVSLAAATGDLFLGAPADLAGKVMNAGARMYAISQGVSRAVQGEIGEQAEDLGLFEGAKQPLQTLAKHYLGVEPWDQSAVSSAIDSATDAIAKASKGALTSKDAKLLLGTAMDAAGVKGLHEGGKLLVPKEAPSKIAPRKPVDAETPATPQPMSVADVIKQSTGVKTAAEVVARTKASGKDVKEAFKDTDEADYYQFKADELARNREQWAQERIAAQTAQQTGAFPPADVPKTRMQEAKILFEQPDLLQSALEKQRNGQGFDMSAEEKVALRAMGRKNVNLQRGAIDKDLLIGLGAAGLGLGLANMNEDQRDTVAGLGMMMLATKSHGEGIQGVLDSAAKGAAEAKAKAAEWGGWKFQPGEQIRSADTGRRYQVQQHWWDSKADKPVYLAQEMGGDGVSSLLDADKVHESFGGDTPAPVNKLEGGKADPKLLARLSAVGLGAASAAYLDPEEPTTAAILGAIGGGLILKGTASISTLRKLFAPDTRIRIDHLVDDHEVLIHKAAIESWRKQNQIEKLAPKAEDRALITNAIQAGTTAKLPEKLKAAADVARGWFSGLGEQAKSQGVLPGLLENYVTQLWDLTGENRSVWEKLKAQQGGPSMSPESRFALTRRISSIEEGKKLGLTPLTEDISAIAGIYGNALSRTMANKKLLDTLKAQKSPEGTPLIMGMKTAPQGYVPVDHPQMNGKLVHPDITPSLQYVFDNYKPGLVMKGLDLVSTLAKRAEVSFSLFHAKALTDAYIGAGGKLRKIPGFLDGTNEYLKQLRQEGGSPLIDKAIKGGLKFSLERLTPEVEDVGANFYHSMEDLQKFADSVVPGSGLAVKGVKAANEVADKYMWARLHAGMKLQIFAERYEALLKNNEAIQPKEAAKVAASYTNDLFGGLNWRRIAEGVKTTWGRDIVLALTSPHARAVERLMMFAPDWTVSTTRAAIKAFGQGSGVRGALPDALGGKPKTLADLHRQYLVRSAIYYLAVGNAINLTMSGHNIWENKDPTRIDLGNGQTMQWSKHTMEPVHWVTGPGQQAVNKLGVIPSELADQALKVEYLNTKGRMPPMKNRLVHAAKRVVPIVGSSQTPEQAVGNFIGTPIYGKARR